MTADPLRLALVGYGGVGHAFARALRGRAECTADRYGVRFELVGIRSSQRELFDPGRSPDFDEALPAGRFEAFLERTRPSIVVQAIPSDRERTDEALAQVLAAFAFGADVVTATKSHLVTRWAEIAAAARTHGRRIRISAAAGAALPAVDLGRRGVRGFDCVRVRGSLNGTSNFVLEEIAHGNSLARAIGEAQARGIAEPDPSGDLSGRDAGLKLLLLANILWGRSGVIDDVALDGIDAHTAGLVSDALAGGRVVRSVAEATREGELRVSLQAVGPADSLFRLEGAEKLVEFDCEGAGRITVFGGRSSPDGAALAMLKDVINLATGDGGIGFD